MAAACSGNTSAMSSLLSRGANVNDKEKEDGWSALFFAVAHKRTEAALLLLDCPEIDLRMVDSYGQSLLHLASSEGCIELLEVFLQKGVDVDWQDVEGNTAFDVAESEEAKQILKHAETMSRGEYREEEEEGDCENLVNEERMPLI